MKYKSYSKKELCSLYEVSMKTLQSWLAPLQGKLGDYRGRAYSPLQVKMIFEFLGEPEKL